MSWRDGIVIGTVDAPVRLEDSDRYVRSAVEAFGGQPALPLEDVKAIAVRLEHSDAFERKGDVDGVIASLTAILERDPRNWSAAEELGKAYERKGDVDGAIASLTAISERDPDNSKAAEQLGNAYERKGDVDGAIAKFTALAERTGIITPAQELGKAYERKGDVDAAIVHWTGLYSDSLTIRAQHENWEGRMSAMETMMRRFQGSERFWT